MIFSIIGMVIGGMIFGGGIYYFVKEKDDQESRKIYGIMSGVGTAIFIGMLIRLLFEITN